MALLLIALAVVSCGKTVDNGADSTEADATEAPTTEAPTTEAPKAEGGCGGMIASAAVLVTLLGAAVVFKKKD